MRHSVLLATTFLVVFATPALAQTAPAEGAQTAAVEEQGLDDIVVTAQRRSENLQNVPLSVTAIRGDKLDAIASGGQDIRFLSARVPSLIVESSFGRTFPRFYIRGLGNTDFDFNASQPVSLVYDDVVLENPILKGFPVFDLDRVEVLRGPQGTLFGRNTPAGIVKFDSVKPSAETSGYGRVSYGSFNGVTAQGAIGGALAGDTVTARLSGIYQRQDGYVDNVLPSGTTRDRFEGFREFAGRAQLLIKPSEDFNVLLSAGSSARSDGTARLFRANVFTKGQTGLNNEFRPQPRLDRRASNEQKVDTLEPFGAPDL